MLNKNKLLILKISSIIIIIFIIIISSIRTFSIMTIHLGDHWIYEKAIERYINNQNFYTEYFGYFPSFFILFPLIYNLQIYAIFLTICSILSCYLLFKLIKFKFLAFTISYLNFLIIFSGNIDPFIFFIILICLKYKEKLWIVIPLSFVSFKPSLIFITPIFLYYSQKRFKSIFLYGLLWILFNSYFIIYPNMIFEWFNYSINQFGNTLDVIRPSWIYFCYFYLGYNYFKMKKDSKIIISIPEVLTLETPISDLK